MSRTSILKPEEMRSCCLPAGQSVLEGLNALLDHRAEVYIPELAQAFACPPSFRVFAAQNPVQEGGGRRGLPKSFLNRFTRSFSGQRTFNSSLVCGPAARATLLVQGSKMVLCTPL